MTETASVRYLLTTLWTKHRFPPFQLYSTVFSDLDVSEQGRISLTKYALHVLSDFKIIILHKQKAVPPCDEWHGKLDEWPYNKRLHAGPRQLLFSYNAYGIFTTKSLQFPAFWKSSHAAGHQNKTQGSCLLPFLFLRRLARKQSRIIPVKDKTTFEFLLHIEI